LLALHHIRRRKILVKTAVSLLMEREGNSFKNVLLDDLLLATGDFLKVDSINSPNFATQRSAALVPGVFSSSLFEITAAVMARIVPVPGTRRTAVILSRELKAGVGLDVDARAIERVIRSFYWLRAIFRLLLRLVRPEVVVVSTVGEHALCAAAREEGIPVVEFQHGIMDRFNPGYAWTEYAVAYRDAMSLPTRLLLFGEHWREELAKGGFWGDDLRVVGSVRMDEYRTKRRASSERRGRRVVWTTQGIDVQRSIEFMAEFLRLTPDPDLTLQVKLHPLYDADHTPYQNALGADSRVVIEGVGEGRSTFAALVDADLHVSIYSASHFDALGLGVPTAVLPFRNHDVVSSLVERGDATLVQTPADLATLLRTGEAFSPDGGVREYYFRSSALRNAKDELTRLLTSDHRHPENLSMRGNGV
jgi:hypothetical protein